MPRQAEETFEYDDFLSWTVTSLKDFLALRGLKQSGTKAELVARAFGAYELNAPKKYSQEEIYTSIKQEYSRRLSINGIKTDPKSLPNDSWADNIQEWPEIDDGKLFSYILRVKAVDADYIGKYKDQKAYSYWMSGFVDTVFVSKCPVDSKFTFLKGNVCPSQRLRNDPHQVWVCTEGAKSDCSIVTSWCTCTAGTGEVCNHVIALLYKVNYAFKKDYVSPACTSVPQGWNVGTRKEVAPSQLRNLTFRKHRKTRKESERDPDMDQTLRKVFDPRKPQERVLTNERVSSLLNGIKQAVPSACVLNSIEHGKDDGLPQPLAKKALNFMSSETMKGKPIEQTVPLFLEHCQMTTEQVKAIEVETRGQSMSSTWQQQRTGRVTASNFHLVNTKAVSILKTKGKSKRKTQYTPLVLNLLNKGDDISYLPQIKWGIEHEKDAIKSFMSDIASQHDNGIEGFKQCGLFIKGDYPYLAASPDGMFTCKCCNPATIEVKCPYSVRNENLHNLEAYKRVEFLEDVMGEPRLKRSHKYYTQMQAQMWATGVDHGYFVAWTQGHKPLYEKVEFDGDFCASVVINITLFYKAYVLPCLLGYRDIYQCPKCEKVILEEPEISEPAKENSVCCDSCNTWWHLPCAGQTQNTVESMESWVCCSCLAGAADIDFSSTCNVVDSDIMDDSDHVDGVNQLCSVCVLDSIPVGGEHICSVCRKAVHAWCSNHEEITSSTNLICNLCSTD